MATKKITDLVLIDEITGTESFPVDDSIQTYRSTATQLKDFILPDGGLNISKLSSTLINILAPTGKIDAYGGNSAPTGWLICDGSAVSRETYSDLYGVVGINFGQGDGSTTFNLPDLRGRFLRGVADGSSNDPDRASRTAMNTGGNTGDAVGSVQGDATKRPNTAFTTNTTGNHQHTLHNFTSGSGKNRQIQPVSNASSSGNLPIDGSVTSTVGNHSHSITGGGDSETRPLNAYVHFIIKT